MPRHEVLNNITHANLRIQTQRNAEFGDNVMTSKVYPSEFGQLQSEFPIVFSRIPDSQLCVPAALMGFEQHENLYLDGQGGWKANYLPMLMQRQPFSINQSGGDELNISVDMDSPRVSETEGEAVFLPSGGNSEYIEYVSSILLAIHEGESHLATFSELLNSLDLLEPFFVDIPDGNQTNRLSGFLTINEQKLAQLDGQALSQLHQHGALQAIYMVLASMSNMPKLVKMKQGTR